MFEKRKYVPVPARQPQPFKFWPCAEWEFHQVSPDEVHLYRHRDGLVLKAKVQVQDTGVQECMLYIYEYLPLYVCNKLREMLNLIED
jgi:hypothetical protein